MTLRQIIVIMRLRCFIKSVENKGPQFQKFAFDNPVRCEKNETVLVTARMYSQIPLIGTVKRPY